MKRRLLYFILFICTFLFNINAFALSDDSFQNGILLDVGRRYYTVEEIKKYIDALGNEDNTFLQLHLTDDENVGIENTYLDQTKEKALVKEGNVYINPKTNKAFLTYDQITEIMDYCKSKNVEFIPEIDVPAHMTGFFTLARLKFGDEFVNKFAKGTGSESGNIDIVAPEGDAFIFKIFDEYTAFFKDCKYIHIGFDEYTYRIDEKADYISKLFNYLDNKGFIVRMWNDSLTKNNIEKISNKIEVTYWDYYGSNYATVDDLEEKGFKVIMTNSYYLFFVPSVANTNKADLEYTVNDILNNWDINKWDRNVNSKLNSVDNVIGNFVCLWSENSAGVEDEVIRNQVIAMFKAMIKKTKHIRPTKYNIKDNENIVIQEKEYYLKDDVVEFTVKEKDGYEIESVKINNEKVSYTLEDGKYKFNMPNSDVEIIVEYKKNVGTIIPPNTIDYIYTYYLVSIISTLLLIFGYRKLKYTK